ncbi:DUF2336 domain-containing protein [Rhizobium sp. LCM 4573]|uniref:DUF2336 domain-containing protein n=1 Tax=Rhizobium sp. LCM 4573 TaxID=1848291 RepID=UPI0018E2E15C|nr:DUF2336 domain-containing protein [Rhizobium sp. LCM 4573]
MIDQFRDLERPAAMRRKDVVLMATITSFESLARPSRSELRQFAELFAPLFSASTEEARRQAVAALSQCPNVPPAVAFFIATQPIAIAAPFLTASACLDDETLVAIARTQGEAHVRAIVRREALSPTVIDALVGLRYPKEETDAKADTAPAAGADKPAAPPSVPSSVRAGTESSEAAEAPETQGKDRLEREEELREQIKALAAHIDRPASDRLGLRSLTPAQEALLVRFARNREAGFFASVLADALSASRWLSERIMLDISGQQLAATLKGLAMQPADALFILERLYDHLSERMNGESRAEALWGRLDGDECYQRVEAWRRADSYTYAAGPRTISEESELEAHHAVRPQLAAASSRRAPQAVRRR